MAKSFKKLMEEMTPARRAAVEDRAQNLMIEMALQELRQSRQFTQQQLADIMKLNQAAISKMENQADMHVSTLRRLLAAMGAELRLIARFPDGDVLINQFDAVGGNG